MKMLNNVWKFGWGSQIYSFGAKKAEFLLAITIPVTKAVYDCELNFNSFTGCWLVTLRHRYSVYTIVM